ncbi:MAG: trypsin-like peptidase domain-containing protein [Erysipelotrichaceae bacterium]|nr:trypsin-like peptidase domain-containing protein [Erysipelotrichaceae bacterium]
MNEGKNTISADEFFQRFTIRIVSEVAPGILSTGTGFFYQFQVSGKTFPCVVTNTHVIGDGHRVTLVFSKKGADGGPAKEHYRFDGDVSSLVMRHPQGIDLSILFVNPIYEKAHADGSELFIATLLKENIPTLDYLNSHLSTVEDVIVVGYPDGIWDEINNLPIIRKGITATPVRIDFKGRHEFLIDCAIFPGSSGSPVLVYNKGSFSDGASITLGERLLFVGVVSQTYLHDVDGKFRVVQIPTAVQTQLYSQVPNNLGIVIKSSELFGFESALSLVP